MKQALGKGLAALISENQIEGGNAYIPDLPIDQLEPNPYQPRIQIDPGTLVELSDSIREYGIIEPLIVTKKEENRYEIIAGERRWRAAQLAGVSTVPVVIKEASPQQMLELAVIENIQRADLNPLEEALAFQQLVEDFKVTHGDIAKKVGLSRPAVANKIRLLTLPEELKRGLLEDKISEGHARALLGLTSIQAMLAAYRIVTRDKLSVRAVEELVRRLNEGHKQPRRKSELIIDQKTKDYESQISNTFGLIVKLFRSKKGGRLVIPFNNDNELEKIYNSIVKN